jgi:hypothetical protein
MQIFQALALAMSIADAAVRGSAAALAARDMITRIAADGRDPTPEEWDALTAAGEDLHRRIQEA